MQVKLPSVLTDWEKTFCVFRALKADPCDPRVQAFLKRLLQITTLQLPPFSAAVLTLLSELIAVKPSLTCSLMGSTKKTENLKNEESTQNELENPGWLQDEDDDEHFVDVKEDSDAPERFFFNFWLLYSHVIITEIPLIDMNENFNLFIFL